MFFHCLETFFHSLETFSHGLEKLFHCLEIILKNRMPIIREFQHGCKINNCLHLNMNCLHCASCCKSVVNVRYVGNVGNLGNLFQETVVFFHCRKYLSRVIVEETTI